MMIGSLFGEVQKNPWIFHSFNLAIHLANVTLAFFVVRTLIRIGQRHTRNDAIDNGYDTADTFAVSAQAGWAVMSSGTSSLAMSS